MRKKHKYKQDKKELTFIKHLLFVKNYTKYTITTLYLHIYHTDFANTIFVVITL